MTGLRHRLHWAYPKLNLKKKSICPTYPSTNNEYAHDLTLIFPNTLQKGDIFHLITSFKLNLYTRK